MLKTYTQQQNLPESDQSSFTTAVTLYTINTILCTNLEKGDQWKKSSLTGSVRPNIEQLERIFLEVKKFWDLMTKHFSVVNSVKGKAFREVIARNRSGEGGHLLFRPVAQMAMARAVRMLRDHKVAMEPAFEKFESLPTFEMATSPWEKVVWRTYPEGGGGRMIPTVAAQNLAARLLLHWCGFISDKEEHKTLLGDYRNALGNENARLPRPIST